MDNLIDEKMKPAVVWNLFRYTLFLKAFDGLLEISGGIVLLTVKADRINQLVLSYVHDELTEEPNSKIANYLLQHGHLSTQTATFTSILLLARGIVKLLVIGGLLKRKVWVYPIAIIVFGGFVVFQLYSYTISHSAFLLLLSIFDLFVIWLTTREYRILEKRPKV